jgi:ribosome maturation factor RimP
MWGRLPTFFCYRTNLPRCLKPSLEEVVTQELDGLGYDLVELRRGGSRSRPVFEIRLERRDGAGVTVDDCARASRAIEARLEATELVPERYELQVSSPGIERPLRNAAEWRRFTGQWASVSSPALNGRLEVEIVGVEGDVGAEVAVVRDAKGVERRVALADVTEARLAFRWQ